MPLCSRATSLFPPAQVSTMFISALMLVSFDLSCAFCWSQVKDGIQTASDKTALICPRPTLEQCYFISDGYSGHSYNWTRVFWRLLLVPHRARVKDGIHVRRKHKQKHKHKHKPRVNRDDTSTSARKRSARLCLRRPGSHVAYACAYAWLASCV